MGYVLWSLSVYITCTFHTLTFAFRVYEKIMDRMQEVGSTITGFKKSLAEWAKKKGLEGNKNFQKK